MTAASQAHTREPLSGARLTAAERPSARLCPPCTCAAAEAILESFVIRLSPAFIMTLPDVLIRLWESLTFWRYPQPALSRMRLRPGHADQNALMVCTCVLVWNVLIVGDVALSGSILHLGGDAPTDELVEAFRD